MFVSVPVARDKPASKPTSNMLIDAGTLIKSAITKIKIATSKASARNCKAAFGSSTFTVFVIPMPWATSPSENPAAPSIMANRLLMILEPTAGPTHADRLLPETNITVMKVNTRITIESHSIQSHLRMDVTTETIRSERSSQESSTSSHLCKSSE